MKGDMELSKVAEFTVLLVVLAIGIGMLIIYSQGSKEYLGDISDKKYNTTMIQAESFSDSQLNLYIRSCWQKVQEKEGEDFTCYILEGDMSRINKSNLTQPGPGYKLDVSGFNTNNPIASVSYDHIFKKIVVTN